MNFFESYNKEQEQEQRHQDICVRCNKEPYRFGNNGLCYSCVQTEIQPDKLEKELKSELVQITLGIGELRFLIEELRFIKRSHEGAYWYGARLDMVKNTLSSELQRVKPKKVKELKNKK